MPFTERSIMSHREEFCRLACCGGANVRELCRRFGIGSATAYKWLGRYRAEGAAGLCERSRRPKSSPSRLSALVEDLVAATRLAHPAWGGRKIRRVLQDDGLDPAPSASTVTAILRRRGLLDGPRAGAARAHARFEHDRPNDLWQMDFKGHVATAGAGRLHPLTVLDDHSRYALALAACGDEREATVKARLEAAFRVFGLPWRMLADNGPPWGACGGELTGLAVWLMDLDVALIHGRPYHPQTQGKDERFHRTLKAEAMRETFPSLAEAQTAFDAWRALYNGRRPHEALGMAVPASRYAPSPRPMPATIAPPDYEPQAIVRKVCEAGRIGLNGRRVVCSKALAGKRVALRATNTDGVFDLCYRRHVLAQVDLRQNVAQTVRHVPERTCAMSQV